MKYLDIKTLVGILFIFFSTGGYAQDFTIAGGVAHSVMICPEGQMYAWGYNMNGNPEDPNVVEGEPGTDYGVLGPNGGTDEFSSDTVLVPIEDQNGDPVQFQYIDPGTGSHTLALTCDGHIYAWGNNNHGQLGNPDLGTDGRGGTGSDGNNGDVQAEPVLVDGGDANNGPLENVISVETGNDHSYALLDDGRVVAWGSNVNGQLGNDDAGPGNYSAEPVFVQDETTGQPIEGVTMLATGDDNGYALTEDGSVYSWGIHTERGTGADGDWESTGMASREANAGNSIEVENPNFAGYQNIVLPQAGFVVEDANGEQPDNPWAEGTPGNEMTDVVQIAGGDRHLLIIRENGDVWASGNNGWISQIGYMEGVATYALPVPAPEWDQEDDQATPQYLTGGIDIVGGQAQSVVALESGEVVGFGSNRTCELGSGANDDGNSNGATPFYIDGLPAGDPVEAVSRGDHYTFFITESNAIYVLGANAAGQLGLGDEQERCAVTELNPPCDLPAPQPEASLPDDFEECFPVQEGDIELNGQDFDILPDMENDYAFRWYHDNDLIPDADEASFSPTEPGVYRIEIEYIGDQAPCDGFDIAEAEIEITEPEPPFSAPDPNNNIFCEEEAEAQMDGTGDYEWFTEEENGVSVGTSTGNNMGTLTLPDYNDLEISGTEPDRIITLYAEDPDAYACGRIPVEVHEDCPPCQPPSAVSIDQSGPVELCIDDDQTLTGEGTYTPSESVNGGYYYSWIYDDGTGETVLYGPDTGYEDLDLTNVNTAESGTYILRVEDGDGGDEECYTEESIEVIINEAPEGTIALSPETVCINADAELSFDMTAGSPDYTVTYTDPDNNNQTLTGGSPLTVDVSNTGTYALTEIEDDNGCTTTISDQEVTLENHPELTATSTPLCDADAVGGVSLANDEFQIQVEVTGGDAGDVEGDNGVTFTDNGDGTWYSGAIDEALDIEVTVVDQNNCQNVVIPGLNQRCSCPASASIALSDEDICEEGSTTLTVSYETDGNETDYDIVMTDPNGDATTETGASPSSFDFTVSESGSYSATVTSNGDACEVSAGSITLNHFDVPEATISGTETICDDGTDDTDLTVTLTEGTGPFNAEILLDGTTHETLTGETSPYTLSVNEAGDYTLDALTDANGCEGTVSGTATITTITPPEATMLTPASGTTDQTGEDTYGIEATDPGAGYTLNWSIDNGQGNIVTPTDPATELIDLTNVDETTDLTITVSDNAGVCADATDNGSVERVDQTIAYAGEDDTICEGTTFTRMGNGIITGIETASWSNPDGADINVSADGKELTVESTTAPGTYNFVYTVEHDFNGPTDSSFVLTIDEAPSLDVFDPASIPTCEAVVPLEAPNYTPSGATLTWSVVSGPGSPSFDDNEAENTDLENVGDGTTVIELTAGNGVCPEVSEELEIEKLGDITPAIITLDGGHLYDEEELSDNQRVDLCVGVEYTLRGAEPDASLDETGEWSSNSGTLSPSDNSNRTYTFTPTENDIGTSGLTWEISNTIDDCEPSDRTVEMDVLAAPEPELAGDTAICETDSPYQLQVNVSDEANDWRWIENGVHATTYDHELAYDITDVGSYEVYVEEDNSVCPTAYSDTVMVQIDRMPVIEILSNRYIGMVDEDLPLQSLVNPYDSVMWTHDLPYNLMEKPDSVITLVNSPEGFIDERFVLYAYNGECMDTAGTDVTIRTPVKPYNSFTPNGDGINDTWTIEGIETYTGATIRVYNRWGSQVHEQLGGYTEPWNGTRNGNELPVGTYYYIIDLGDASTPLRGDVTIVR